MVTIKTSVRQASCLENDWLICDNSHQLPQLTEEFYLELTRFSYRQPPPKIILAEREPVRFLAGFLAARAANCPVFLCNPDWGKQEWQQVFDLVQPDVVWGAPSGAPSGVEGVGEARKSSIQNLHSQPGVWERAKIQNWIMIPTGGSSGKIKFAIHTWETLTASVRGFTEYFQVNQVNSFCVLPLYHVSGLMQFLRCFTTGGKLIIAPFKAVETGKRLDINPAEFFISLVPTQLHRLLQNPKLRAWLCQFETVLLGGAPAWNELLEKARYYKIRLAPTYGMTETASQIAALKPDDFLNGKVNSGKILPHAKVTIYNQQGEIKHVNQTGNITIYSQSLAKGYYPQNENKQNYLQVDDLGFLDNQGYLNIVGRSSDKIITGGENVHPAEIESAIRATEMVDDVCVIGIPDKHWGQAVTAIYIPKSNNSIITIQTILKNKLCKFKIPKHWLCVQTLPRNPQGKINRQQLQQIAIAMLKKAN